jgi:hypothetical protein
MAAVFPSPPSRMFKLRMFKLRSAASEIVISKSTERNACLVYLNIFLSSFYY